MNHAIRYSNPLFIVTMLMVLTVLSACDTNQPRLSLLEANSLKPTLLEEEGVKGLVMNLQAKTRAPLTTSLTFENTGNNVLSFSALPAESNVVQLEVSPARSTLVQVGQRQDVSIKATCPERSGTYPTQLTLLNNDITKPRLIVALMVRCTN